MINSLSLGVQNRVLSVIGRAKRTFLDRYGYETLRATVVLGCLLLTVLAALIQSRSQTIGLALVAGGVGLGVVVLVYRYPAQFLLLMLVVSVVFNFGIGTGTGTNVMLTLVLSMLVMGTWLIRMLIAERSFRSMQPSALNGLTFGFAIVVLISLWWGGHYVVSIPRIQFLMADGFLPRLMTGVVLIMSPVTMLLFANHILTERQMKFIVWWFIGIGFVLLIFRLLPGTLPPLFNIRGQFIAWVIVLTVGQLFFNRNIPNKLRLLMLISTAGWLYIAVGAQTSWLSGWVPAVVGLTVLIILRDKRLLIAMAVFALVFVAFNWDEVNEIIEAETIESGDTRAQAGQQVIRIFEDHFLFGTGPTGYHYYMTVYVGGLFQLSHNNYIDILAQTGIVGFSLFALLWLLVGWTAWKTFRMVPRSGFRYALGASLLACYPVTLISRWLGDWVTPFTYTQTLSGYSYTIWHWVFAGMTFALYHYETRQQRATRANE